MAATENVRQVWQSHNSPIELIVPRHGVVTLFGYGVEVRVDRNHLLLKGGIGPNRCYARFPRVGHGLKRLVCIGNDGLVTLSALRWLSDVGASFVMLDRLGKVRFVTGPVRPSDAKLRRAQALAFGSEVGLKIARELISQKLNGQEQVVRDVLRNFSTADEIGRFREALPTAESLAAIRDLESQAAAAYWGAWRNVPITFPAKDLRVCEHWRIFGTRKSLLTGSPRLAVNPANAVLNYLYALLESECRLAAAVLGLDPGLGVLHVDTPARDSLACDLMEAVRPQIDRYVLGWILSQPLRREWFFEERNGNCRLMSSITARLSETATTFLARAAAPVAEWVAQELWASTRKRVTKSDLLPTRLTQRRKTEARGREFVPTIAVATPPERVCRGCGAPAPHGQRCSKCGRESASKSMTELARIGRLAAQSVDAQRKRSEKQLQHKAAQREWCLVSNDNCINEEVYCETIQPRLASVTISAIASALKVSIPYAADIRAGRRRPHPRHWSALARLVGVN